MLTVELKYTFTLPDEKEEYEKQLAAMNAVSVIERYSELLRGVRKGSIYGIKEEDFTSIEKVSDVFFELCKEHGINQIC